MILRTDENGARRHVPPAPDAASHRRTSHHGGGGGENPSHPGILRSMSQLQSDFESFVAAHRTRLAGRARSLILKVAFFGVLALIAVTAVISAVILVFVGAARAISTHLYVSEPLAFLLVGGAALGALMAFLAHRRRSDRRAQHHAALEARAARAELKHSARTLARELARPHGLLTASALGFVGMRLLRYRTVRGVAKTFFRGARMAMKAERVYTGAKKAAFGTAADAKSKNEGARRT